MTQYNDFEIIEAGIRRRSVQDVRNFFSDTVGNNPTHVKNTYNLHELSLTIKNGTKISLIEVLRSMEIYEDIFAKSIHGFIEINDIAGGLSKFMITGGETITLTVLKPIPSSEIIVQRTDLVVHQISKVQFDDFNALGYKLQFIPLASVNAQKKRLYTTITTTRSIQDIIGNLYSQIEPQEKIFNRTSNLPVLEKDFSSPGYTPYEAIDILTKSACQNDDYYVFFERLNRIYNSKHVFSSLNNLREFWTGQGAHPSISYQPNMSNIVGENESSLLTNEIEIQDNYDHINNMNSGFYNSRVRILDLIYRNYYDVNINYSQIQDQLGEPKILNNGNIFLQYDPNNEIPGERLIVRSFNSILADKSKWIKNEVYGSILLSSIRVNVQVSGGNNLLGVGNFVNLKMPSFYAKSLSLESSTVPDDSVYSGKYIVTAVRHIFNSSYYMKKIELSKDHGKINMGYTMNTFTNSAAASGTTGTSSGGASPSPPSPPPPPPPPRKTLPPNPRQGGALNRGGKGRVLAR